MKSIKELEKEANEEEIKLQEETIKELIKEYKQKIIDCEEALKKAKKEFEDFCDDPIPQTLERINMKRKKYDYYIIKN